MKEEVENPVEGGDERVDRIKITRVTSGKKEETYDVVVTEAPLTILLNGEKLITLLCTPQEQEYLTVGFLFSEGFIQNKKEIERINFDRKRNEINIVTKSKGQLPSI